MIGECDHGTHTHDGITHTQPGEQILDQVTLAPGLVIQNQSIGVAIEDAGFDGVDGIIGYATSGRSLAIL